MKAIMYHYVRPFDRRYPYFKNLHLDDFKMQLDYFENKYGFISKNDFVNSLKTGIPKKGVILTFDDALSCHYKYVFKELKRRNIWGIFYVPTLPYIKNKIIDVHRIHLLLGKVKSKKLFNSLNEIINDSMIEKSSVNEFKKFTYTTQENDSYSLYIKRVLNYFVIYNKREEVIDKLMNIYYRNEKNLVNEFYLKKSEISEMHDNGMIIGSHTENHPVMSRLNYKDQEYEIQSSFKCIKQILKNLKQKTYCHPYGGHHSFNEITLEILNKYNCDFSFNVDPRDIEKDDLKNKKQSLPRYNCNQFKFGQIR
tara:strand:- start:731 stop:1657 length:927 start_codon:yes stop_codon:yes gene_type:complete